MNTIMEAVTYPYTYSASFGVEDTRQLSNFCSHSRLLSTYRTEKGSLLYSNSLYHFERTFGRGGVSFLVVIIFERSILVVKIVFRSKTPAMPVIEISVQQLKVFDWIALVEVFRIRDRTEKKMHLMHTSHDDRDQKVGITTTASSSLASPSPGSANSWPCVFFSCVFLFDLSL